MVFLEELVKRGLIKEEQISEVLRIADEKYNGSIDEALVDFKVDERKNGFC